MFSTLFAASRRRRASANDADRLKKFLARFDLAWTEASRWALLMNRVARLNLRA